MIRNRSIFTFLLVGFLSGVLCWAGSYWLQDNSFFAKPYPGIVLGLSLFSLGHFIGALRSNSSLLLALVLVAFSILGWRLSIDVGYVNGDPLPFVTAGAIGAFSVSLGLLLAWQVIKSRYLFVFVVTLGGAVGGLIFRFIEKLLSDNSDNLWVFLLFVEWQVIFLAGIWAAMIYTQPRAEVQSNTPLNKDAVSTMHPDG